MVGGKQHFAILEVLKSLFSPILQHSLCVTGLLVIDVFIKKTEKNRKRCFLSSTQPPLPPGLSGPV